MAPHGLGRYGRPHSDGAGYKGHLMARPVREVRTGRYSMERVEIKGHPVNGEVERGSALSGSQIWFPVRLSI